MNKKNVLIIGLMFPLFVASLFISYYMSYNIIRVYHNKLHAGNINSKSENIIYNTNARFKLVIDSSISTDVLDNLVKIYIVKDTLGTNDFIYIVNQSGNTLQPIASK